MKKALKRSGSITITALFLVIVSWLLLQVIRTFQISNTAETLADNTSTILTIEPIKKELISIEGLSDDEIAQLLAALYPPELDISWNNTFVNSDDLMNLILYAMPEFFSEAQIDVWYDSAQDAYLMPLSDATSLLNTLLIDWSIDELSMHSYYFEDFICIPAEVLVSTDRIPSSSISFNYKNICPEISSEAYVEAYGLEYTGQTIYRYVVDYAMPDFPHDKWFFVEITDSELRLYCVNALFPLAEYLQYEK